MSDHDIQGPPVEAARPQHLNLAREKIRRRHYSYLIRDRVVTLFLAKTAVQRFPNVVSHYFDAEFVEAVRVETVG